MKKESYNNCVDYFKNCTTFVGLSEKEKDLLRINMLYVKYKAGETIFKQGTPFSHLVGFKKGFAKVYVETGERDFIISLVKGCDIILDPGMWVNGNHHFSLSALADTEIVLIDINAFQNILQTNIDFSNKIRVECSKKEVFLFKKLICLTQKHMSGRLAGVLTEFSRNVFQSDKFDILISRQELADLTAMSKESICRILKEFKDSKIIDFEGNTIEILNPVFLEKIRNKG